MAVRSAKALAAAALWRATPSLMAAHLDPTFQRYRHSDLLARAVVDAVNGRHRFQIVNMQPQIGKSFITSRWGPTWVLERRPWQRLFLISYADTLAYGNGRVVRNNFLTYADRLTTRLAEDSRAAGRFHTTEGGGLLAAGVGGPITGNPADGIIVDDPHKNFEEAHSETMRDKVWDSFLGDAMTRLQENGWVLVVSTRWHEDDLSGRLIREQPGRWHVTRLPCFAEPTVEEPDPLGRQPGEVVDARRFSQAELEDRKLILGSYKWAGLYQQRPAPAEGGILKRAWWRYYSQIYLHEISEFAMSWDLSFKDADDSSYVVGQVWGRNGPDKYLIDQVRERLDYPETKKAIVALAAKWPQARTILVEDKANGPAIIADLRRTLSGLVPVTPLGSKESRVHAVAGDVESGHVWLPNTQMAPWIDGFVNECASFPTGQWDDQVDAMSQMLLRWSNADQLKVGEYSNAPARGRR